MNFSPARAVRFNSLVLELTRKCTKRCSHCGNYSGPEASGFMETDRAMDLVHQADQFAIRRVRLTGGEPLLHPDVNKIVKYAFRKNFDVAIASNGFWGVTEDAALEKFSELLSMKPQNLRMQLILSCDPFHATDLEPDLDRIANILTASFKVNRRDLVLILNFQNIFNDPVLSGLFKMFPKELLLSGGQMDLFRRGVLIRLRGDVSDTVLLAIKSPLDMSIGRAKNLSSVIRSSLPLSIKPKTRKEYPFFCGIIYVSFADQVYADFLHSGERIYPLGSLSDLSLRKIVEHAQSDPFFNMLHNLPSDKMVAALDDLLPLDTFLKVSHSPSELFSRLYLHQG